MDKTKAALLGAAATLATMGAAQAATEAVPNPSEALQASSYAELLAPVPNAVALMQADDAARTQNPMPQGGVEQVQFYYQAYHHHHHHHHHAYYHHHHHHHAYYHHHHHHHHHSAYVGVPGGFGVIVGR